MKKSNPLTQPIVNRPNLELKLKQYLPCDLCADTVTGIPHGIVGTVDAQTNSNKIEDYEVDGFGGIKPIHIFHLCI